MTAFLTLDIVCRLHVGSYFFGVMLKSAVKVIHYCLLTILTSYQHALFKVLYFTWPLPADSNVSVVQLPARFLCKNYWLSTSLACCLASSETLLGILQGTEKPVRFTSIRPVTTLLTPCNHQPPDWSGEYCYQLHWRSPRPLRCHGSRSCRWHWKYSVWSLQTLDGCWGRC